MPHVALKLFPGRSREQLEAFARDIRLACKSHLESADFCISVSYEEVTPECWDRDVYIPDIMNHPGILIRPEYQLGETMLPREDDC